MVAGSAFANPTTLKSVFYKGNGKTDFFEKVSVANGNNSLRLANIYYYSETQPTEEQLNSEISKGKYWHYATDGCTPLIW